MRALARRRHEAIVRKHLDKTKKASKPLDPRGQNGQTGGC
jgi:hypothetical protein